MGQCGCGEDVEDKAAILPDGTCVAYGIYEGCVDCDTGIGVGLRFYDTKEHCAEWVSPKAMTPMAPTEYGGNDGNGIGIPIMDVDDLVHVVAEMESEGLLVGNGRNSYGSISEWMEDNGLDLLQRAIRRRKKESIDAIMQRAKEAP
jgi:hypothetical protein